MEMRVRVAPWTLGGVLVTSCTLVLSVLALLAAARPRARLASSHSGGPTTFAPVGGAYVSRSTCMLVSKFAAVPLESIHVKRALATPSTVPASFKSSIPAVHSRLPSSPVPVADWLATWP